jgi:cobyrinic acid a,c-diamide synthase
VAFAAAPAAPAVPRLLEGVRIAIARDAAFSFIYEGNLETLQALGARLAFFSPLADAAPPACDALWLPGGYPELHAAALAANRSMQRAVHAHVDAGKPLLAECGGMLFLLDSLTDAEGRRHPMAGALPGDAVMRQRFAALGLQAVDLAGGTLRGHSFHYSSLATAMTPVARGRSPNGGRTAEAVYARGRTTAGYIHHYFASNPVATAGLFAPGPEGVHA